MKHQYLHILIFILLYSAASSAQDVSLSNPYNLPLFLNPAYSGSAGNPRLATAYRLQWPGLQHGYSTGIASYDQPLPFLKGGIGIKLMADGSSQELIRKRSIGISYSHSFTLNQNMKIIPGIGLSAVWMAGNLNAFDPPVTYDRDKFIYPDLDMGVIITYNSLDAGFAIDHINTPNTAFTGKNSLQPLMSIHGRYNYKVNEMLYISPSIVAMVQNKFSTYLANFMVKHRWYNLGIAVRSSKENVDAVIGTGGIEFRSLRIFYSYDYTVSKLGNSLTGGAHECSLSYTFN